MAPNINLLNVQLWKNVTNFFYIKKILHYNLMGVTLLFLHIKNLISHVYLSANVELLTGIRKVGFFFSRNTVNQLMNSFTRAWHIRATRFTTSVGTSRKFWSTRPEKLLKGTMFTYFRQIFETTSGQKSRRVT